MVTRNSDDGQSPWLPVFNQGVARDQVAPSKPAMPAAPKVDPQPEPIDTDDTPDSDIVAPVTPPAPEEILPWSPASPAPSTPVAHEPAAAHHPPLSPADSPLAPSDARLTPATGDPYRELGDAAVRRASLSASGAPALPSTVPSAAVADNDAPMYTPRISADEPAPVPPPDQDDKQGDEPAPSGATPPWWRSLPALVIAGLLVMAGVTAGLYVLLAPADEVELTPEVIVAPPETPALDPVTIEDPTDFQGALPGVVGTYALTSVETPQLRSLELPVRAAEASELTYDDQRSTLSLLAIQHFDQEAAVAQFEALGADGENREPVESGGTGLGERVTLSHDDGQTILWRNGTAVFQLTGPADAVETFYASYPF